MNNVIYLLPALPIVGMAIYELRRMAKRAALRKRQRWIPGEEMHPAGLAPIRSGRKPVEHVHHVVLNRSVVQVMPSGGVYVRCAVANCDEPIYIDSSVMSYAVLNGRKDTVYAERQQIGI